MDTGVKQHKKVKGRAPKHQNKTAFTHNPNSKKTAKILATVHPGLCQRCYEQIEWRKQYRKYKPLKTPAACMECKQKVITLAYHNYCVACAKKRDVCEKCGTKEREIVQVELPQAKQKEDSDELPPDLKRHLKTFRERTKRTLVRKLGRGDLTIPEIMAMEGDKKKKKEGEEDGGEGGDDDDDDDEDLDDDEDEDDDDGDDGNDNNKGNDAKGKAKLEVVADNEKSDANAKEGGGE